MNTFVLVHSPLVGPSTWTPTADTLSIGGLVKHIAAMERSWMDNVLVRTRSAEEEAAYDRGFTLGADETLANALAPFAGETGTLSARVLTTAGIDPRRRPETLEVIEIARLADTFAAANT